MLCQNVNAEQEKMMIYWLSEKIRQQTSARYVLIAQHKHWQENTIQKMSKPVFLDYVQSKDLLF